MSQRNNSLSKAENKKTRAEENVRKKHLQIHHRKVKHVSRK